MKIFPLLPIFCFLQVVMSQTDLPDCKLPDMMIEEVPFPDIEKLGIESYQMAVEFTLPEAGQTDYYTEYYDSLMRMGRVDSHQEGENLQYIYRTDTKEAWNLKGDNCELKNLESTPDFFRNYQENWLYLPKDRSRTTIGPSAMFKMAYDRWNNNDKERTMAYLGESPHLEIRGLKTQSWRWCETPNVSVDFFFTAEGVGNAYSVTLLPLRVHFKGKRAGSVEALSDQYYDIIGFQPFISLGMYPFQLPKGKNCRRLPNVTDVPDLPDFSNKNLFFSAEVIYRKVEMSSKQDIASFYSTLRFALDVKEKMIAYRYSPWNTTLLVDKEDKSVREVNFLNVPEYVIYDMFYGYAYLVNYDTGKCEIGRGHEFSPSYKLPQNNGAISLTDASILFPNNELSYLTNGFERGVSVDIFETVMDLILENETLVQNVIVTHTYLRGDERVEGEGSTRYAPTQVQLRLYRTQNVEEILTFNFFGFTTKLPPKNILFDVRQCFKNDDDYSWVTFGFEAADGTVPDLSSVPIADIQYKIMEAVDWTSLTPLRVPTILVDIKEELYVSLMILEKPPLQLDFASPVIGKGLPGVKEEGIDDFKACARACLQKGDTCWGLSMCGNDCILGKSSEEKEVDKKDCNLFVRYDKEKVVLPKKSIINSLNSAVAEGKIKMNLMIKTVEGDQQTELRAMFFTETDPAGNDPTFDRMGHNISPRMRIFKQGRKLKKNIIKSLGKMRFEECQRFCLDFKDCETVSFCLINSDCGISTKYGEDIKDEDMDSDDLCEIVTKKYAEHFVDSPGYFIKVDAASTLTKPNVEECAQACLKNGNFKCLSFDYCGSDKDSCRLHTTHYLSKGARKEALDKKANCIHYTRKYSTEFKKNIDKRVIGAKLPPITNLTLEECAKSCIEYSQGACLGYDFCQGTGLFATSCTLLDTNNLDTTYSPICTNYLRDNVQMAASKPYSTGYAGGIGFLCFLIGGVLGAVVVFGIAYCRVNRR